jgi:hypothetical protein
MTQPSTSPLKTNATRATAAPNRLPVHRSASARIPMPPRNRCATQKNPSDHGSGSRR